MVGAFPPYSVPPAASRRGASPHLIRYSSRASASGRWGAARAPAPAGEWTHTICARTYSDHARTTDDATQLSVYPSFCAVASAYKSCESYMYS